MTKTMNVWRVDGELLTLEQSKVYDDTPIDTWLPAMYVEGSYIYKEDYEEAKTLLKAVIRGKIRNLEIALENLND